MRYLIILVIMCTFAQGARRRNYNKVLERRYNLTLVTPETTSTPSPAPTVDSFFDLLWTETTSAAPPQGTTSTWLPARAGLDGPWTADPWPLPPKESTMEPATTLGSSSTVPVSSTTTATTAVPVQQTTTTWTTTATPSARTTAEVPVTTSTVPAYTPLTNINGTEKAADFTEPSTATNNGSVGWKREKEEYIPTTNGSTNTVTDGTGGQVPDVKTGDSTFLDLYPFTDRWAPNTSYRVTLTTLDADTGLIKDETSLDLPGINTVLIRYCTYLRYGKNLNNGSNLLVCCTFISPLFNLLQSAVKI